jgi:hypothetical protein
MSLWTATSSIFAIKPNVTVDGNLLIARSSLLAQILLAFFYGKKVVVDRHKKIVTIETRLFWFIVLVKQISFQRIAGIGYRVRTLTTDWSFWEGAMDQWEFLSVSLELTAPRESVLLFRFMGEGAIETGASGVLWSGDDIVDFKGDQTESAQRYMDLLEQFVDKKVVPFN